MTTSGKTESRYPEHDKSAQRNPEEWVRDDVADPLVEELGFELDPRYGNMILRRGDCVWETVDRNGTGVLEGSTRKGTWNMRITPNVPAHIILGTVREAIADCPDCGTACDGHDGSEVTVGGEVI